MTTTQQLRPEGRIPAWDLSDRLGKALRDSGIGVSAMADQLGISRETIGRWINGRGKPRRGSIVAWAAITGVDFRWLETGEAQEAPASRPTPPDPGLPRLDSNQQPSGYASALLRCAA
jgi:transcriptional regulator with XRE-family HTH domain